MSSILKALEKVEESQNPRRHGGAGGLARGRERRPAWVIPAWALGGAAVATLATFAIMGGFSRPAAPPVTQQVATVANSAPVVVAPLNPLPQTPAAAPAATLSDPVKTDVRVPKAMPNPVPAAAAKPARLPVAAVAQPASVRPAVVQAAPVVTAPVPAAASEASLEKPRQEVRVTGIAWQKDAQSSVAMVNGRPVRQGGVVDGFKVEQIYEDSVRFSGTNGSLTVPLGAGEEQP